MSWVSLTLHYSYSSRKYQLELLCDFILCLSVHLRVRKELMKTGGTGEDVDKGQHLFTVGGIVVEYYRNQCEGSSKAKLVLQQDPPLSLLGKRPKGSSL